MLLTGQPLHAFDLDRVAGGRLVVRRAADGEKVETLDGQVRDARRRDGRHRGRRRPDVDRRRDGRRALGGRRRHHARADGGRHLGRAEHQPHVAAARACAARRARASRRACARARRSRPRRSPRALMVELCGATPGRRDDRRRRRRARTPAPISLRDGARRRAGRRRRWPRATPGAILRSLGFGVHRDGDGRWSRRAALARARRLPRGRPRRGGRAHRRRRPPAGDAARAARRRRPDAGAAGAAPRRGRPGRPRPLRDRRLELHRAGAARPPAAPGGPPDRAGRRAREPDERARVDPAARRSSARCSTRPRTTSRAARPTSALFESAPSTGRATAALPDETPARWPPRCWSAAATCSPPRADCSKRVLAHAARASGRSSRPSEPFLHPGKAGVVSVGGEAVGLVGEVHPLVARAWDIDQPVAAFAIDLERVVAAAPRGHAYRDVTSFPSLRQDIAVVVADDVPAAPRRATSSRERRRRAARERARSSTSTAASSSARAARSLALHLEFRAPDRTLTDEDVAPRARGDRRRAARRGRGRAACLSVARRSGPAASPARWPRGSCTAIPSWSSPRSRRAATRAAGSTTSTRSTASRWCSTRSTSTSSARSTPRSSPTRTARRRRRSRSCTSAAIKVVDLSADFRLRDLATYEECYVQHPAPRADRARRSTACPSATATTIARRRRSWPTPAATRRRRSSRSLPLAPYLDDVVIDAKSGVSGAGRAPTETTHFVSADENVTPYGVGRHRHTPEIEQELGVHGAPSRRTWCRSTRASWCPATSTLDRRRRRRRRSTRSATPTSRSSSSPRGRPACATSATPTSAGSTSAATSAPARSLVFAVIDNLWKGAASQAVQNLNLMLGLDETAGLL